MLARHSLAAGVISLAGAFALAGCMFDETVAPANRKAGGAQPGVAAAGDCGAQLTAAGPFAFEAQVAQIVQLRPNRMRIEAVGDVVVGPSLGSLGACATVSTDGVTPPALTFTGGTANVKVGAQTIAFGINPGTGDLAFGELLAPPDEAGVAVADDAVGNVLEIIWPELAGDGASPPIVRVQLSNWDRTAFASSATIDVTFSLNAQALDPAGTLRTITYTGAINGIPTNGDPISFAGAPAPCPTALAPASGTIAVQTGNIVQFRANRLRIEAAGDVTTGTTLDAIAPCTAAIPADVVLINAKATVTKAGSSSQVTTTHQPLTWAALAPVADEPGIVLAEDADGNVFEIIWPSLDGVPTAPIVRVQLATWDRSRVVTGKKLDLKYEFTAQLTAGGVVTTKKFTGTAKKILIPAVR